MSLYNFGRWTNLSSIRENIGRNSKEHQILNVGKLSRVKRTFVSLSSFIVPHFVYSILLSVTLKDLFGLFYRFRHSMICNQLYLMLISEYTYDGKGGGILITRLRHWKLQTTSISHKSMKIGNSLFFFSASSKPPKGMDYISSSANHPKSILNRTFKSTKYWSLKPKPD